jgi:hypothetical protein
MSIAEKLTAIAENEQKVFDAGKKAEHDVFWDELQEYGNKRNYLYTFAYWNDKMYHPKYPIVLNSYAWCASGTYMRATIADTIVDIVATIGVVFNSTFSECSKLVTIRRLVLNAGCEYMDTFSMCSELMNLNVEGTIGKNGFNVSNSPKLTHDSLMRILNCLEAKTEGTWTVTLGATNLAKLTDAEKAIATEKGWTLA